MDVKDYIAWHDQKTLLQGRQSTQYFYEQEVWWTALGLNIGFEENGKNVDFSRPVLILRKFNYRFFLGVPLSTQPHIGRHYYGFQSSPQFTTALISQVRALDARRLINLAGRVSDADLGIIRHRTATLIAGPKKFSPRLWEDNGGRGIAYL
ncbi:MAG TPA: type II toxin-antitoxin system PemK/MazF family toxin [Candidatus Saccharimonadia bacterium]|nr:type II toxin-antitoxin system PemK/MazF family toxin [Candidatus Saccharimonadia bacterium]